MRGEIGAMSFGKTYGINPDRPSTHPATLKNDVLVIDLKDVIQSDMEQVTSQVA